MSETSNDELELFNSARKLPPVARAQYLYDNCSNNPALRERVEQLLNCCIVEDDFLESTPVIQGMAGRLENEGLDPAFPPLEHVGDRVGPYKLLKLIGEGGCGVVYCAEQETPIRRLVALKIVKLGMDTRQVIARFEVERQALALMDHPNIAKVLDVGTAENGRPYFVMELVEGVKMTEFCDRHGLTMRDRLRLFIQVCNAIQHAHQKGIIHRDIKPANILVGLSDGRAIPKIIDFGIAKATQGRLTEQTLFTAAGQLMGTPAYMSPEQVDLAETDIDTRSDIYSLGVLLYELLMGQTPFDTSSLLTSGLEEMRRTIREQEPLRPSTKLSMLSDAALNATARLRGTTESVRLVHLVRGDLDWIVMKCLEKERDRRYETANELARDVERHLNDEPITALAAIQRRPIPKVAA